VVGAALASPCLLVLDHVHFQYNGMLLGMLMLAVSAVMTGRDVMAAILFSVLLWMKHIYAVLAPLFFVFLLRHYCWHQDARTASGKKEFSWVRLLHLALSVIGVSAVACLPVIWSDPGAIGLQMVRRLFPFGRGLCHAYWAPNAWALYNIADKGAIWVARKAGILEAEAPVHSGSRGLVGAATSDTHVVLPDITPGIAALLVLIGMLPALWAAWALPVR